MLSKYLGRPEMFCFPVYIGSILSEAPEIWAKKMFKSENLDKKVHFNVIK